MKKRGQFFILASVVIAVLVAGLMTVQNQVQTSEAPQSFFDLSDELQYETGEVVDYGVYNSQNELNAFLKSALKNIYETDPDVEVIVLYGNSSVMNTISLTSREYNASFAGEEFKIEESGKIFSGKIEDESSGAKINMKTKSSAPEENIFEVFKGKTSDKKVTVDTGQTTYSFDLGDQQSLYMIVTKQIGNETYVDVKN